jgi:hypothetical protein
MDAFGKWLEGWTRGYIVIKSINDMKMYIMGKANCTEPQEQTSGNTEL